MVGAASPEFSTLPMAQPHWLTDVEAQKTDSRASRGVRNCSIYSLCSRIHPLWIRPRLDLLMRLHPCLALLDPVSFLPTKTSWRALPQLSMWFWIPVRLCFRVPDLRQFDAVSSPRRLIVRMNCGIGHWPRGNANPVVADGGVEYWSSLTYGGCSIVRHSLWTGMVYKWKGMYWWVSFGGKRIRIVELGGSCWKSLIKERKWHTRPINTTLMQSVRFRGPPWDH